MKINLIKSYKYILIFALFHQAIECIDNIEQEINTLTKIYNQSSKEELKTILLNLLYNDNGLNILPVKVKDETGFGFYDILYVDENLYNNMIQNWDESDFVTAIILATLESGGLQSLLINDNNFQDVKQKGIYQWVLEHPAGDSLSKAVLKEYSNKMKSLLNDNINNQQQKLKRFDEKYLQSQIYLYGEDQARKENPTLDKNIQEQLDNEQKMFEYFGGKSEE